MYMGELGGGVELRKRIGLLIIITIMIRIQPNFLREDVHAGEDEEIQRHQIIIYIPRFSSNSSF